MRDVVMRFFEGEGVKVEVVDGVLRTAFSGENGRFLSFSRIDEDTGVFVFYSLAPVQVPADKLASALELVARLNYGHTLGNLEIDVESGEIRMKTSIDIEGEELTEGLVANVVYANLASLDQFLPAITAVVLKGVPPLDALKALS
jgi:hypothetical protein